MDFPLGRTWDRGAALIEPADTHAYAAATTDVQDAWYGPDAITPPMFHVRLMRDLLFDVMEDKVLGLDMLKLLHGEHDVRVHTALRPGDLVHLRGELTHMEQKARGLVVEAALRAYREGALAVEARTLFFIRDQIVAPIGQGRREEPAPWSAGDRPPDLQRPWRVDPDQSHRYAEASLDRNPIHIDPAVARAAGLPDVILHGLCTMARAGSSVIRAEGDPRRLRRLAVRWTRPVHNGESLITRIWRDDGGLRRFDVIRPDGSAVITQGLVVLG
jgi:acyl dehydratase